MGIIAKKKKWTLTIQEGLPDDIYMKAAQALGKGIINDDFSAFILAQNTSKIIKVKAAIVIKPNPNAMAKLIAKM